MTAQILTQDYLKSILWYDPETGFLFWMAKTSSKSSVCIGDRAGSIDHNGYVVIGINGNLYKAHRIIWMMCYGYLPPNQIDHQDHNPSNNRLENIRAVTRQENQRNAQLRTDNKSGIIGVYWHKQNLKWQAQIKIDGKTRYLGIFDHLFLAACARKSAEIKYGFHLNHGQRSPV